VPRKKPRIAIVGGGKVGTALATELHRSGYRIDEVICRDSPASLRRAWELARALDARARTAAKASLNADVVWFCVPDHEIKSVAQLLAGRSWRGKVAFHASGALASDELRVLRRRGAAVASVHPLMTFVRGSRPSLAGVPFGIEGDARAVRMARRLGRDAGWEILHVPKYAKVAYHAWGTFASPLLLATLTTAEGVAKHAGISAAKARTMVLPIAVQTLANYAGLGAAGSFSGPIVRGDAAIVRKHLRALRKIPEAREVYVSLGRAALRYLPARNRQQLIKVLRDSANSRRRGRW